MAASLTPDEARSLAYDAYLWGLPLVYVATQSEVLTHVTSPTGARSPINQFAHYRTFPDASNKTVVGFNVDTLYSLAQTNLAAEPLLLTVPPMGDRYWIMQIIDGWNNVPAAPGARTVGGAGGVFALVGPDWEGTLPDGVTRIDVPTSIALIGGRIYTAGPDDYAAVHAIQDQLSLVPLSAWGTHYTPPTDVPLEPGVQDTPVPAQINALTAEEFFNRLNELLITNPPEPDDPETVARLTALGVAPGDTFASGAYPAEVQSAIDDGVAAARQAILEEEPNLGEHVNGWAVARDLGRYGTRYLYRAAWTYFGVGGNLAEDAIYPLAVVDGEGRFLDGTHRYTLHFTEDELPPVNAFWSVTMYDADSYLVPNEIDVYALGNRSGLHYADDGSLTIAVQAEQPDNTSTTNWLPAPRSGRFKLALRLYHPREEASKGIWQPPAIRRLG